MKTSIEPSSIAKPEYPRLMESTMNAGKIVLFTDLSRGVLLHQGNDTMSNEGVGHYSDSWAMSCFKPYYGKVILDGAR